MAEMAVRIVDYDDRWPAWFEDEARRLRGALGEGAVRIEHVGSTAVPGLPAKPVLDIVLAVRDSAEESDYAGELESAGFVLRAREPGWFEHRFFDRAGVEYGVNLHVFSLGCSEIERMLAFRDHLRADADDRRRYASVKRVLAERSWRHVQEYADAKDAVVDEIHHRIDPDRHQRVTVDRDAP